MTDNARTQAAAQLASIRAMVAALECDFDRLEELRDERASLSDELDVAADCVRFHHAGELDANGTEVEHAEYRRCLAELAAWDEENAEELAELAEAAGDCSDEDEARQRIEEDALSVEVRSDWATLGEELTASEYRIVLCTGGPHVEIVGDLDRHGEPKSARLLYQDWGTGKQEYICDGDEVADLLTYAGVFYFGE